MATTEPKPIFDKPMDELREAFIRARFAQEDVFGRPDIEEWLAREREAECPEYNHFANESQWNAALSEDDMMWAARQRPLEILSRSATGYPTGSLPTGMHPFGDDAGAWDSFAPLFLSVHGGLVYYGHTFGAVIAVRREASSDQVHAYAARIEGERGQRNLVIEPFAANRNRASIFAMDALFAEWLYRRPRWREARQFLCDTLARTIASERTRAEADFDTAVAVSADGTKICSADWVVVFGESASTPPPSDKHGLTDRRIFRSTDYRYPASAFREQKVLLAPRAAAEDEPPPPMPCGTGTFKHNWLKGSLTIEQALARANDVDGAWYRREFAHTRCHAPKQTLLCCKDGRVLFVHRDQCPSPLPEGGVELTV